MTITRAIAILCSALLMAQRPFTFAQPAQPPPATQTDAAFSPQQLDSLVAPIALYPDPILSQVLVASTYPLEIVEASRWLGQNANLKGQALADAAKKQSWDASVQALVLMPDVMKRLDQDISWTSDLGNAFLAQQEAVMQSVQRMRQKASAAGALQSSTQQTVSTTTENGQNYIVIEPASPEVVYVPQYNPEAVWGPPAEYYPYPPIYYPPVATGAISFGAGVVLGAILTNNNGWRGWGWNCGWGRNNVVINNNFINNNHFNRVNIGNGNNWVHNPAHRAGVPYANRNVATRFQGSGAPISTRPTADQTQQRLNQTVGQRGGGVGNPGQGGANRLGQGGSGQRGPAVSDRMTQGIGQRGGAVSPSQGNANRMAPGNFSPQGGGDRIGNRNLGGSGGGQGAFGGMGQSGGRTRMDSNRGSGSMGGGFRGGGGGGFRGGGGGSRGGGRRR